MGRHVESRATKPMVLAYSLYFYPEMGGGATRTWNISKAMAKLGYKLVAICSFLQYPTGHISDEKCKGRMFLEESYLGGSVQALRIRLPPIRHEGFLKRGLVYFYFVVLASLATPLALRKSRPRAVYCMLPSIFSVLSGVVWARLFRCKLILDVPDLWPEQITSVTSSKLAYYAVRALTKWLLNLADAVTAVSNTAARILEEEYLARRGAKVYVVPSSVDLDVFKPLKTKEARSKAVELGLLPQELESKFLFVYTGVLGPFQRIDKLLEAVRLFNEENPDLRDRVAFVLVGEGELEEKLKSYCASRGLDNVYFLGKKPRENIPLIIGSADVCILPLASEIGLALPTKFFEYVACGKPVLCLARGDVGEEVKRARLGVSVDLNSTSEIAEEIRKMVLGERNLEEFEESCRNYAKNFSIEKLAESLAPLL